MDSRQSRRRDRVFVSLWILVRCDRRVELPLMTMMLHWYCLKAWFAARAVVGSIVRTSTIDGWRNEACKRELCTAPMRWGNGALLFESGVGDTSLLSCGGSIRPGVCYKPSELAVWSSHRPFSCYHHLCCFRWLCFARPSTMGTLYLVVGYHLVGISFYGSDSHMWVSEITIDLWSLEEWIFDFGPAVCYLLVGKMWVSEIRHGSLDFGSLSPTYLLTISLHLEPWWCVLRGCIYPKLETISIQSHRRANTVAIINYGGALVEKSWDSYSQWHRSIGRIQAGEIFSDRFLFQSSAPSCSNSDVHRGCWVPIGAWIATSAIGGGLSMQHNCAIAGGGEVGLENRKR